MLSETFYIKCYQNQVLQSTVCVETDKWT